MRKFTKILFLVAVAFFLTGCVGPQKTEDTEQSKEGETEIPEITVFDVNSVSTSSMTGLHGKS